MIHFFYSTIIKASVLITFSFLFLTGANRVLFFSLHNDSQYDGDWNIEKELTEMIARKLNQSGMFKTFLRGRSDKMLILNQRSRKTDLEKMTEYAKRFNASLILSGKIEKFSVATTGVVSPGLGGWKMYSGQVRIVFEIIDTLKNEKKIWPAESKITDHDLGIALFGGPGSGDDLNQKSIMTELEKKKFGSKLFNESIIGRSVNECINGVVSNMITKYPAAENNDQMTARISDLESGHVYINAGLKENLIKGQTFLVYRKGDPVRDPETGAVIGYKENEIAEIEITRVIAARMSKAAITKHYGSYKIQIGDRVKLLK